LVALFFYMKFSEFLLDPVSSRDHLLLIGNPVSHSVSPIMHNLAIQHHALDLQYVAIEVLVQELPSLIAHFNSVHFKGANITLPYKETLFSAVDRHSDLAEDMQVINCIQKIGHELIGHNTDSYGFVQPLKDLGLIKLDSALIFGYGGATKAVIHGLREIGVDELWVVSRNPEQLKNDLPINLISYDEWVDYAVDVDLIVNTTPLGMQPNIEQSPVDAQFAEYLADSICYDIVYNPQNTTFLRQAAQYNCTTIGGLPMLIYQAARSFELWTDHSFPMSKIKEHLAHVFPT